MVFSVRKIFLSDEEQFLSNVITHHDAQNWDVQLQYKIHHFQTSEKPKTANLINAIYK